MTATEANTISLTLDGLHAEVERYLSAVDAFRSEGCEPRWSSGESLPTEALRDPLETADVLRRDSGIAAP